MTEIHLYLLRECRQIPWTGNSEKELKIQQTKVNDKKSSSKLDNAPKSVSITMPNWPYTKNVLQELIKYDKTNKKKLKLNNLVF